MSHKILFVNACVREISRTKLLANYFLGRISGEVPEVDLNEASIAPLTRTTLGRREKLLKKKQYDDPMFSYAKQFAEADVIVVAAPYWDLSFPAVLKAYLETISVEGITYRHTRGNTLGLCRAKRLVYITSAGGIVDYDMGYNYIKVLAQSYFQIPETVCFRAEEMDFGEVSIDTVINQVKAKMDRYLQKAYDLRLRMSEK